MTGQFESQTRVRSWCTFQGYVLPSKKTWHRHDDTHPHFTRFITWLKNFKFMFLMWMCHKNHFRFPFSTTERVWYGLSSFSLSFWVTQGFFVSVFCGRGMNHGKVKYKPPFVILQLSLSTFSTRKQEQFYLWIKENLHFTPRSVKLTKILQYPLPGFSEMSKARYNFGFFACQFWFKTFKNRTESELRL